jgi:hypothetical protein
MSRTRGMLCVFQPRDEIELGKTAWTGYSLKLDGRDRKNRNTLK